ncbi:MAG: ParB/RepB/Spo0J family partition protein [Capsulimonas sp.]|uniref:ParB/RepB/Spo0J family partition protein n=1 Tax=Capsulimonas sp. TaxID=2494211 RepID=UPI0032665D2A
MFTDTDTRVPTFGHLTLREGDSAENAPQNDADDFKNDADEREAGGISDKLRVLANGMQAAIDVKLVPRLANTNKRAQEAEQAESDARRMQRVQSVCRYLADAHDAGTIPAVVSRIKTKLVIETILAHKYFPGGRGHEMEQGRLAACGITDAGAFTQAKTILEEAAQGAGTETEDALKLRKLMRSLIGNRIPGYFPTPGDVGRIVVEMANIKTGMKTLEPEAGSGHIADMIREMHPDAPLSVVEINHSLREILLAKGHNLVADDFLEWDGGGHLYDRIVMNPPFERGADTVHVRHAYDLLAPGGVLVAIVSAAVFFRSDRQIESFRGWLRDLEHNVTALPHGAFKESDRSTAVETRVIVLEKPADDGLSATHKDATPVDAADDIDTGDEQGSATHDIYSSINDLGLPVATGPVAGRITRDLPLGLIQDNRFQPRELFNPSALASLATSMQEIGQIQPILVRPAAGGKFELVAGDRRFRAAHLAGLKTIRAEIDETITDVQHAHISLSENDEREPLSPIERARGYAFLVDLDQTQDQIAKDYSISQTTVSQTIKLLELPEPVQQILRENHLSATHGFKLLKLLKFQGTEASLIRFAQDAVAAHWSVSKLDQVLSDHIADLQRAADSPYFNATQPEIPVTYAEPGPLRAADASAPTPAVVATSKPLSDFTPIDADKENTYGNRDEHTPGAVAASGASAVPTASNADANPDAAEHDARPDELPASAASLAAPTVLTVQDLNSLPIAAPAIGRFDPIIASPECRTTQHEYVQDLQRQAARPTLEVPISQGSDDLLFEMGLTPDEAIAELHEYRLSLAAKKALRALTDAYNENHSETVTPSERLSSIVVVRASHSEENN